MEVAHGHRLQQLLASNLAYGRPAPEGSTLIPTRQNGSSRPPCRPREAPLRSPGWACIGLRWPSEPTAPRSANRRSAAPKCLLK
jgi:hypothetical protein